MNPEVTVPIWLAATALFVFIDSDKVRAIQYSVSFGAILVAFHMAADLVLSALQ